MDTKDRQQELQSFRENKQRQQDNGSGEPGRATKRDECKVEVETI